jgi:hypothetical protein
VSEGERERTGREGGRERPEERGLKRERPEERERTGREGERERPEEREA